MIYSVDCYGTQRESFTGAIGLIVALLAAGCDAPATSSGVQASPGQHPAAASSGTDAAPNAPSIDVHPQDLWKQAQLSSKTSGYAPEQVDDDLKQGNVAPFGELSSISLKLSLPPRERRVWGSDGRTFFVLQGAELLRIAVPAWRVTHRVNLGETTGYELTNSGFVERQFTEIGDGTIPTTSALAMTAEGLVVAMRHVERAGGNTGRGGELIYFHKRTGKVIDERVVVRQLIVFDPDTLAVTREFHGPASAIAASPASPVIAVAEQGRGIGLLDLRTGKVLDAEWLRPAVAGASPDPDVPEMVMDPGGKSLYLSHGDECVRIDVSQGKLQDPAAATFKAPLAWASQLRSRLPTSDGPAAFELSPDGSQLAVYFQNGSGKCGYRLIPTNRGVDSSGEREFEAYEHTSGCAFAGPKTRFIYTMNLLVEHILRLEFAGDGREKVRSVFVKLAPEDAALALNAQLCGWPAGEHLLLSIQPGTTLLIRLPPAEK